MGTALKRMAAKTLRLKINLGGNTTARELTAKSLRLKNFAENPGDDKLT